MAELATRTQTILVDGVIAGHLVCFGAPRDREVGYWLGREQWGKGIATQALARFLVQVTQRPLHAVAVKSNLASIRVLEKCGFRKSQAAAPDEVLYVLD